MTLTLQEVEHIASLAHLELSAEEKECFRQQLSAILEYAAGLQKLDTSGITITTNNLAPRPALRPDVPHPGLEVNDLLANAPQIEDGQFRVPLVMD